MRDPGPSSVDSLNATTAARDSRPWTRGLMLFYAAWALWLCSPLFTRGPLSYLKIHVNADSHISHILWLKEHAPDRFGSLLEPSMCGADQIADYGVPTLFHWTSLAAGVPLAYVLLALAQLWIAAFSTYRFCRDILGVSAPFAFVGGMAFALGAARGEPTGVNWIYLHLFHEPGFPLFLYWACRVPLERWSRIALWGLAMGALQATASIIELGILFTFPCALLFGLIARSDLRTARALLAYGLLFAIVGLCVVAYQGPHLWAAALHAPESARSVMQIETRGFNWAWGRVIKRLTEMKVHVALAAVWLCRFRRASRTDWALLVLLLITLVLGPYSRPLGQMLATKAPILAGFFLDRLALYAPFCLVCAGALGLDRIPWPRGGAAVTVRNRTFALPLSVIPAFTMAVVVLNVSMGSLQANWRASLAVNEGGQNWHRLYRNPELLSLAEKTRGVPIRTVTAGACDAPDAWQPAFNLAYGLETADGFKMLYPWRYHQFWRQVVDVAYSASEDNLTRSFMDVSGSRMYLFPPMPEEVWPGPGYNLALLSLANVGYIISPQPLDDPRLRLTPPEYTKEDFANWARGSLPGKILGLYRGDYLGSRLFIYENPLVLPRFFLPPGVLTFASRGELLKGLGSASVEDLRASVYVSEEDAPQLRTTTASAGPGTVLVKSYALEHSRLDVTAPAPGCLVFSNTYSPFWRASIDGAPVPIFPAYHTFMGITVPAGQHVVEFRYAPPYASWVKALY